MPVILLMPALSPTMTQGHLVKWHAMVGDPVKPGQSLFDIETDKAVMDVEAVDAGILVHILVPDNTSDILVGKPIGVLKEDGDSDQDIMDCLSTLNAPDKTPPPILQPSDKSVESAVMSVPSSPAHAIPLKQQRVIASPLAKKMAQQRGIDLSNIFGSGPNGRIVRKDIDYVQQPEPSPLQPFQTAMPLSIQITPMRKAIAQRLTQSKATIPHFYLSLDCQMDALLSLRTQLNEGLCDKKISINDLVVRACVLALRDTPDMQNQWQETHIMRLAHVDIAVAVSIEGGLITPIVPAAETLSFQSFVTTLHDLIGRARNAQLKPIEYQGGTFAVSNLGMLGIDHFKAIINPPHSGILAIGATKERPIVIGSMISIAHMMTATLSADHRVVDGSVGASFLSSFKRYVEHPLLLLY